MHFYNIIMSEYYILIPKSLNLGQRLSKFPPDFKLSVDYCHYFISELIKESCNKDTEEYGSFESVINHFIPRCAGINQSIYRNSKQHINYLYQDFGGEGGCFGGGIINQVVVMLITYLNIIGVTVN
jgi:hypothetical protein